MSGSAFHAPQGSMKAGARRNNAFDGHAGLASGTARAPSRAGDCRSDEAMRELKRRVKQERLHSATVK
jgi:hypothetical protein